MLRPSKKEDDKEVQKEDEILAVWLDSVELGSHTREFSESLGQNFQTNMNKQDEPKLFMNRRNSYVWKKVKVSFIIGMCSEI